MIWRGKRKSCLRRIHEITTNSRDKKQGVTSTILSGNNQDDVDHNHQQYQTSLLKSFDLAMRTIIESRQANIENRTQKMISFQNTSSIQS